jgi:hypothetical protein
MKGTVKMPEPLNQRERQLLRFLIQYASPDGSGHYITLRKAGVPEKFAEICGSTSEFLDSLMNREMQKLRDKRWITMRNSVYKILHTPDAN